MKVPSNKIFRLELAEKPSDKTYYLLPTIAAPTPAQMKLKIEKLHYYFGVLLVYKEITNLYDFNRFLQLIEVKSNYKDSPTIYVQM